MPVLAPPTLAIMRIVADILMVRAEKAELI